MFKCIIFLFYKMTRQWFWIGMQRLGVEIRLETEPEQSILSPSSIVNTMPRGKDNTNGFREAIVAAAQWSIFPGVDIPANLLPGYVGTSSTTASGYSWWRWTNKLSNNGGTFFKFYFRLCFCNKWCQSEKDLMLFIISLIMLLHRQNMGLKEGLRTNFLFDCNRRRTWGEDANLIFNFYFSKCWERE